MRPPHLPGAKPPGDSAESSPNRSGLIGEVEHAQLHRPLDGQAAPADAELAVDVRLVPLDRVDRHVQTAGDLPGRRRPGQHAEHIGEGHTPGRCDVERLLPSPVGLPQRAADLALDEVTRPAAARHALGRLDDVLAPGILERARLIASELVTNAIIHGGGRADVRYWHERDEVFIEVADDGPGIDDPFAALRPPALPVRGFGLWASHIEATRLHVAARHPHDTRTAPSPQRTSQPPEPIAAAALGRRPV